MYAHGNRAARGAKKGRLPRTAIVTIAVTSTAKPHGYVIERTPKVGNETERVFALCRSGRLSWVASLKGATWFDEYDDALIALNGNSQNGEAMAVRAVTVVAAKEPTREVDGKTSETAENGKESART